MSNLGLYKKHFQSYDINFKSKQFFFTINCRPREEKDGTKFVTISEPTVFHCKSTVGKLPGANGKLYVEVHPDACEDRDIYHELLHSIGLLHEHQR